MISNFLKSLLPALVLFGGSGLFIWALFPLMDYTYEYNIKDWHFSLIMTPLTLGYFYLIVKGTAITIEWYMKSD